MMKKIYIVRHGEAVHQVNSDVWKTYADEDIPLSSLGRRQAKECGLFFQSLNLSPEDTLLITSPYVRATETADEIKKVVQIPQVIENPLLVEQNFGIFTGLSTEQCYLTYPKLAKKYDLQEKIGGSYRVTPPDGESKEDVVKRTQEFVKGLGELLDSTPYQNIIIVAHCVIDRALFKTLNQASEEWFLQQERLKNCAIREFSYDGKEYRDLGFVFTPREKSKNITIANNKSIIEIGGKTL